MTEFRSDAEKFVSNFLDYVHQYDILDKFNKQTQKMERSAGVQALVKEAQSVFPERKPKTAGEEMKQLTDLERDRAIAASGNVVDTREMFARRIARNGGTQRLLRDLYKNEPGAREAVEEFLMAEDGEKEFASESKVQEAGTDGDGAGAS